MDYYDGAPQKKRKPGRPKEPLSLLLERIGNEFVENTLPRVKKKAAMCRKMYELAIDGDVKAATFIADRTEGKAPQPIQGMLDVTSDGDKLNPIIIVSDDETKDIVNKIMGK